MITNKTPTSDFRKKLLEILPDSKLCYLGADWLEQFNDTPFGEVVDLYLNDDKSNASWACGAIELFGNDMSQELKDRLLSKITEPSIAFWLYIEAPYLSERDAMFLKSKFEGKLPRSEASLKSGECIQKSNPLREFNV